MSIPNSNNPKSMRNLLRGLRYISQRFENEKEQEMKIGNPTDVKHVAHIGWDGNSDAPPSWMTGFKGEPDSVSPNESNPEESEQKTRATSSSGVNETPRRHSTTGESGSKQGRQTRRSTRNGNKEQQQDGEAKRRSSSKERVDQDGQKKGRRKKSKDSNGTKSKSKAVDPESSTSLQPGESQMSSSTETGTTAGGLSPVEEDRDRVE
ncbi:CRIB domain-containing protein RIC7 [Linum perenne]